MNGMEGMNGFKSIENLIYKSATLYKTLHYLAALNPVCAIYNDGKTRIPCKT